MPKQLFTRKAVPFCEWKCSGSDWEGCKKVESEVSTSRDGAFSRRRRGGVRVQHGKRGVLSQAAADLPVPAAGHRGLRDDVRGTHVL